MHGGKSMTTPSTLPTPSYHALEVLKDNAIRISAPVSAERLWNRYLTPQDRERLPPVRHRRGVGPLGGRRQA